MNFMQETLGEQRMSRIVEGLSPEARHAVQTAKPADWTAVSVQAEVLRALAAESAGDEARARDALIASGEYVAREATNTFLRLLMKMLTPALFARKLPDFWKRDCSRGRFEVDVTEQKLVCRLFDVGGFDHVPCTTAGFVKFALAAMGKSVAKVDVYNWSLAAPCADGACIELTWKT